MQKLRDGIRAHRDSTGQDLCWHHPALWGLLPERTDPLPTVPEWPHFIAGCVRYRESLDRQASAAPRSGEQFGGEGAAAGCRLDRVAAVLASLDIERTVAFYCTELGFTRGYVTQGEWGIVSRDDVELHFWACSERHIAENTSCRVYVSGIAALYDEYLPRGVVHPNAPLQAKPWGTREFGVLDRDGNLITFAERQTE